MNTQPNELLPVNRGLYNNNKVWWNKKAFTKDGFSYTLGNANKLEGNITDIIGYITEFEGDCSGIISTERTLKFLEIENFDILKEKLKFSMLRLYTTYNGYVCIQYRHVSILIIKSIIPATDVLEVIYTVNSIIIELNNIYLKLYNNDLHSFNINVENLNLSVKVTAYVKDGIYFNKTFSRHIDRYDIISALDNIKDDIKKTFHDNNHSLEKLLEKR